MTGRSNTSQKVPSTVSMISISATTSTNLPTPTNHSALAMMTSITFPSPTSIKKKAPPQPPCASWVAGIPTPSIPCGGFRLCIPVESRSYEGETFHLKDGNEQLPMAFAKRLDRRVRLDHPITAIQHNPQGVTVTCRPYNTREDQLSADALVVCITLPVFRNIPVTPALSPARQYVVDNLPYSSHPFYVFEAASKFWLDDGIPSINMEFEHPDISSIWVETNRVDTDRVILKAFGPGGLSPLRVLAAFRQVYPGKKDTIEQALTFDWTKDKYAPACEMEPFPIGEMHKFWPQIMLPEGRLYFAGTYADNMSRGMESCLRSAQRVARARSTNYSPWESERHLPPPSPYSPPPPSSHSPLRHPSKPTTPRR